MSRILRVHFTWCKRINFARVVKTMRIKCTIVRALQFCIVKMLSFKLQLNASRVEAITCSAKLYYVIQLKVFFSRNIHFIYFSGKLSSVSARPFIINVHFERSYLSSCPICCGPIGSVVYKLFALSNNRVKYRVCLLHTL